MRVGVKLAAANRYDRTVQLGEAKPDVVVLRELKAPDAKFKAVEAAGYGAVWHSRIFQKGVGRSFPRAATASDAKRSSRRALITWWCNTGAGCTDVTRLKVTPLCPIGIGKPDMSEHHGSINTVDQHLQESANGGIGAPAFGQRAVMLPRSTG
jgi:hypothetical protein